jgi:hypothetical protein
MALSIDTSRDLVVKLDISVRSPTIPTHSLFPSPLTVQFTLITSVPYNIINPVLVDPDSPNVQPQDSLCVKVEFVPTAPSSSEAVVATTTTFSDEIRIRRDLLFLRPSAVTAVPGVYKLRVSVSVCLSTEQQTCRARRF